MKTRISLLTICLLVCATIIAAPVDPTRAMQIAKDFVPTKHPSVRGQQAPAIQVSEIVYTHYMPKSGKPAIYVINVGNAFAIVSADDVAHPILGYNYSKSWPTDGNLPPQVKSFFDDLAAQMEAALEHPQDAETAAEWRNPQKAPKRAPKTDNLPDSVGPLLTTTWDQGQYYNALCPADGQGPDGHVYTGCVATAMAQIINYWGQQATIHTRGTHSYQSNYGELTVNYDTTTYDFTHMPNALTSTSTPQEVNAVAKLMYHCGVAVNMQYRATESSAYDVEARAGLINFFCFCPNLSIAQKKYFSDEGWMELLTRNLVAGRPIIYNGIGTGGHSFICDGYKNENYYHFNFGWGGNADGWFLINAINPSHYQFNSSQSILIGILPNGTENVVLGQTTGTTNIKVDEPVEFYHLLGLNEYAYAYKDNYFCWNKVSFRSKNAGQPIVIDFINHKDHNVAIYDNDSIGVLVRNLDARSNSNDYNPIVSSDKGFTLSYTSNAFSKAPQCGFQLRISNNTGCRQVSNIYTSVDTTMVHIYWTENGGADEWQVEYGPKGFEPGKGTIVNTFSNVVDIAMPERLTEYDIYIRPVCGDDTYGPWSPVVEVVTLAPYWTDVVNEQPVGYVDDNMGNITISSAEGLAWLTKLSNGLTGLGYNQYRNQTIKIASNIDMGGYRWKPIGSSNIGFDGVLDGQGYTISNVFVIEPKGVEEVGLFSRASDAEIKNLVLKNVYISGGQYSGGIAGLCGSSITNCIVQGTILGGTYAGGLVGEARANIVNSATICDVSGSFVGNLAGCVSSLVATIQNCYTAGTVKFDRSGSGSYAGDMIGILFPSNVSYCYSLYNAVTSTGKLIDEIDGGTVKNNSYFIHTSSNYVLLNPIPFDGIYYTELVDVLNKGVELLNFNGLKKWETDTSDINDGLPMLGEDYIVTCPNVSNISARNIEKNGVRGVELSWTDYSTTGNWQISYGEQLKPNIQSCDTMFILDSYSNPDTIWNLEDGKTYLFYVRPICDSEHKGGLSEPFSFVVDKPYWVDVVTSQPDGFNVDVNGNIYISTNEGLAWLSSVTNGLNGITKDDLQGKSIALTQDINMSRCKWTAINNFKGNFDGENHTISGLYVNELADNQGLFGSISDCSIRNIIMDSAIVRGASQVGAICGMATNVEVINCSATDSVIGQNDVGGLIGRMENGLVDKCQAICYVNATSDQCGGIIGCALGIATEGLNVRNCFAKGIVKANNFTSGGLIGACDANESSVNIENCYASGIVSSRYYRGAFISSCRSFYGGSVKIKNCYAANTTVLPFIGNTSDFVRVEQCYTSNQSSLFIGGEENEELVAVNNRFYTKDDTSCLLIDSLSLYGVQYGELSAALNAWVSERSDSAFLIWSIDSIGYPILGEKFNEYCPSVKVTCDSLWTTGASISWYSQNSTIYEIEYGLRGFNHSEGIRIITQDTTFMIAELSTGTAYDIYVRVICDDTTHSKWSDVLSIKPDKPYWRDVVTSQPEGYAKDQDGNVYISTAEGLAWLISVCNSLNGASCDIWGKTVHLTNDIDISQYKWSEINDCLITFNGLGHTISGLYINEDINVSFAIRFMSIHNTIFKNCCIKGRISAILNGVYAEMINCGFSGQIYGTFSASVIPYCSGKIMNCYSNVSVSSNVQPTGFLCKNNGIVANCYASGRVKYKKGSSNAQFCTTDNKPAENHYNYWLRDAYNDEHGIYGSGYPSFPVGYVSFSNESDECILNSVININGEDYYTLQTALNAWVDANNSEGKYRHWVADTENVNGGFPIFDPQESPSTDIETANANANAKAIKIFLNGQIYILRGDKVYTLTGQEVK